MEAQTEVQSNDTIEAVGGVFVIERGFKEGKALTTAQKTSALFSEEPVVMGRTLRRGSRPLRITKADYEANKAKLLQLEKAGAIKITRPEENTMKPCPKCGQTMSGGGEFKCPECGLMMTFDPSNQNQEPGQTPVDPVAPPVVPAPEAPVVPASEPVAPPQEAPIEPPPAPAEPPQAPAEEPKEESKEEDAPVPGKKSSKSKK